MNKSEETIYKQAALDTIAEMQMPIMRSESKTDQLIFKGLGMAWNAIDELDPAQPPEKCVVKINIDKEDLEKLVIEKISEAQNKGRWIFITDDVKNGSVMNQYACSKCRRTVWAPKGYDPYSAYPFCHCGAKMEDEE